MKLSESIVLLGGGFQDGSISSKMYYLDLKTMEFTPGPSMQTARTGHGCAALHLEDKTYGVISGGSNGTYAFDSTEMMDFDQSNPTWTDGPKLPRGLRDLSLVETSYKTLWGKEWDLFAMGGPDDKIAICKWREQDQELDTAIYHPVAISLPKSFSCPTGGLSTFMIVIIVLSVLLVL